MKNLHVDPRENAPIKHGLTAAERQQLVDRHFEVMKHRKLEEDLRFAKTIEVGKMLKLLKGG